VKLEGEQLVLDTNILVHWLRGKDAGMKLRQDYELGSRRPRPIIPLVVKADCRGRGRARRRGCTPPIKTSPT
jgi:hypothetical protein